MREQTKYVSDSGETFDSACKAARADLVYWLGAHAENDAIARKIATAIIADPKGISAAIKSVEQHCPRVAPPPRETCKHGKPMHGIDCAICNDPHGTLTNAAHT